MSNEISVTAKLSVAKGDLSVSDNPGSLKFDMSGSHAFSQVFDLTTSVSEITIPTNIENLGWALFTSLDDTDEIEISTLTGGSFNSGCFCVLPSGGIALLPLNTGNLYYARTNNEYGTLTQLKVTVFEL